LFRKHLAVVEDKPQHSRVGLNQNVRHNCPLHKIGPLAFAARVFVLAYVREGPAIKSPVLNRGDVIGNKIVAYKVALLYGGPELLRRWIESQPNRVARSARKY